MAFAQFDIVPALKLAYLTMRKSGCTSIKRALAELRGEDLAGTRSFEIHGRHENQRMAHQMKGGKDWYSFTVVRDPVIRFLSFYSNKILDQNINGNPTLVDRRKYGYFPNMQLDAAIDSLVNPNFIAEPHAIPQSEVLKAAGFKLNHVGHLENLDRSLETIDRETGVRLPVAHHNPRRNSHPLISEAQFDKLADYYRNDMVQFGYPQTYAKWCRRFVEPNPSGFREEAGFEFEDEAKLLNYSIRRSDVRFVVDLYWRIAPTQSRSRYFRVVYNDGQPQKQVLFYLKSIPDLKTRRDENGCVHERLAFQLARIPEKHRNDDLYVQVYFWNKQRKLAPIKNYRGNNKLLLGLPSPRDVESFSRTA